MKLAVLYSGGKDSTMALAWVIEHHTASCLISLKSARDDSYMFHIPNIDLVKAHAEATELPLIFELSSGVKEEELDDLKRAIQIAQTEFGIEGVVAGALASEYQKSRVERICKELGLKAFAPYWHYDPLEYVHQIISNGLEVIFTGVAAEGLDDSWLGQKIDEKHLEKLQKLHNTVGVHIGGEGGEYETLVLDAPFFKMRLEIKKSKKHWDGMKGFLEVQESRLVPKG